MSASVDEIERLPGADRPFTNGELRINKVLEREPDLRARFPDGPLVKQHASEQQHGLHVLGRLREPLLDHRPDLAVRQISGSADANRCKDLDVLASCCWMTRPARRCRPAMRSMAGRHASASRCGRHDGLVAGLNRLGMPHRLQHHCWREIPQWHTPAEAATD